MTPSLAVLVGLLQVAAQPAATRPVRPPDPVRVWRTDSTAYVKLRDPGHVVLVHVDAIGRIHVLFPVTPDEDTAIASDAPVAVPLPPNAQGYPATLVALRSRWPFDFDDIRMGADWNYQDALLLQPTAGDPLGAVLDIAERITSGRPYDLGAATFSPSGSRVARGPVRAPDVCLGCVRHGTAVAEVSHGPIQSSVDCSNASITNAFCGVNSGTVSITSTPTPPAQVVYQPAPAQQPVYVPYYVPFVVDDGLFVPHQPVMAPPAAPPTAGRPSVGLSMPIPPSLIVPSSTQLRTIRTMRH